ncbi:MAG: hypothetical protein GTO18_17975 [Anaerolineales bacterium]|nr:hypothetical protein [Anaerolineales bacterium]
MNTKSELKKTTGYMSIKEDKMRFQRKTTFSIVSTLVWIGFSLYWIAFLWRNFTGFQNIVLLLIAFLVFCASNAVLWASE